MNFIQKVFKPSKAQLKRQQDLLKAAVLLKGFEYCNINKVQTLPDVEIEKNKADCNIMPLKDLDRYVATKMNEQVVKMFEAVHSDSENDYPCTLTADISDIPRAGQGVFLESAVDVVPGTIVALYPGQVYLKYELLRDKILNSLFPDENHMLMARYDDTVIDPRKLDNIPFNPYAFGHLINHCGARKKPNVYQLPFDFPDDPFGRQAESFPHHLRKYIPNQYANTHDIITKMGNVGRCMRGVVFITTRPITNGEELLMDYRFTKSTALTWPEWYEAYPEEH